MNGPTHCLVAAVAVAATAAHHERQSGRQPSVMPLAAGAVGALCTNLPDILEPATSPNHRKICHSVAMAAVLMAGIKKAWQWEPQDDLDRLLRFLALTGGAGYLVHLALDATTKRSLPLI